MVLYGRPQAEAFVGGDAVGDEVGDAHGGRAGTMRAEGKADG